MKVAAAPQVEAAAPTLWRCGGRDCGAGECEHGESELHRHASGPGPQYAPSMVKDVLRSPGSPLPNGVRRDMEQRLGHDFADVRIHTDDRAGASARQVEALAYTVGRHVAFAPGTFDPGSQHGARLLAHELAHAASSKPGSGLPPGDLRVSTPDDPAEHHAHRTSQLATPAGQVEAPGATLMRQQAPVDLTGLSVNHDRVTVPPEAPLSFSATLTPANPTGATLRIAGIGGTTIDTGTTITNAGDITVAAGQAGGAAQVEARQAYTAPDGSRVASTSPFTAPFNFVAVPGGVSGTTASARSVIGEYGAHVRQTFSGGRTIERAHVNETFAGSATTQAGTTVTLTDAMFPGGATISVNNPTDATAGWDLNSAGQLAGDDRVTWQSAVPTARPFVANASNASPSATLPHSVDAVQSFKNLSFPSQRYGASAVATVTHSRMFRQNSSGVVTAVTRALPAGTTTPEVEQEYVGPPVFRNCRVTPATVAPSAPRGRGAPPAITSTVAVDRSGATTPATTFSIQGADLGSRINARSGRVTVGSTAGSLRVRGGDAANYDETTLTIATPAPAPPAAPPTPTPGPPRP